MSFFGFHPLIADWFQSRFAAPTEPQELGWPLLASGQHTLIAAPTGSGKTLTAFLVSIDRLLKLSLAGGLDDEVRVIYVSPLRALSNDMHRNLEVPLEEIRQLAKDRDCPIPPIRVGLRTGDTPSSQRSALVRRPPHIMVSTPESLYLMLTAQKSRETLRSVETVIVDEIHALVRDKRGSHLALSLERLEALSERPIQRIGLSATQKPIDRVARFLVGAAFGREHGKHPSDGQQGHNGASDAAAMTDVRNSDTDRSRLFTQQMAPAPIDPADQARDCRIVDVGHHRTLDLAIETPPSELGAVCTHEQWAEVYQRLGELIGQHRSTLVFVNTRRLAERVTHQLAELLGEDCVGSHHGSLSAELRLDTEQRLKTGQLKAVVATASLELGLDIGYIDLVVQIGSPRSIATLLQRIGRSGHSLGLTPKGRLFALSRDELLESAALIRAVRSGRLDSVKIPEAPLDVLAQQIVAEVSAAGECGTDDLFELFRRADPYRNLSRADFDRTIDYLSEGLAEHLGRSRVYLHHDRVQRRVRPRKGAGISATTNAGAIPEIASYRVVAEPEESVVGTLDEDFAIESSRGDIFLLGNTSWRIQHVRGGDVRVTDARGAPPTIPFWRGEAPGRTLELSLEVSRLREELDDRLHDPPATEGWFQNEASCSTEAARQAVEYARSQKAAVGLLPTARKVIFERFFDETGGMQLVVHAPFGAAINRAWGFAMRKRFCRSFDFELQATADDDGFVLSLGPQHSFPIESLFPMLTRENARSLCEQAVLTVPMYQVRWRWNVTRALLVLRRKNGKKVPPALQRFRADDLLTAVFPRLTGCQEHTVGEIELPDHPLTRQTMDDCLHEALDLDGLHHVLEQIERGEITLIARDTREPSPFSYELLNANVYAFLEGGEIQERRARAVSTRRSLTVESVSDLGRLSPDAIEQVRREAQPLVRDADELHDALLSRIMLPVAEDHEWQPWYTELAGQGRAATLTLGNGCRGWVPAERIEAVRAAFPEGRFDVELQAPESVRRQWTSVEARVAMVRGLMEICGPIRSEEVAAQLSITPSQASAALEALEGEGIVLRGRFTPPTAHGTTSPPESATTAGPGSDVSADSRPDASPTIEWCHRRLLARIHRLTMEGLRREIEPVGAEVFIRFLCRHHGLLRGTQRSGTNGLFEVVSMLQGVDVPAVCWERDLLRARLDGYQPELLDELCLTGEVSWGRLFPPKQSLDGTSAKANLTRVVPVSLVLRSDLAWLTATASERVDRGRLSGPAEELLELLQERGALFVAELLEEVEQLPAQLSESLGELVARGLVTSDGFEGLRQLIRGRASSSHRRRRGARVLRERPRNPARAGRWSYWGRRRQNAAETAEAKDDPASEAVEQWAWQLLRRWGVVFRDLLARESGAPAWFDLLQVLRRLEARGEIRGGRFIRGVAGEQFALGETVRQLRDQPTSGELVVVSAADPVNLVGIVTQHSRVPSTAGNRVAYLDGVPAARLQAGEFHAWTELDAELQSRIAREFGLRGTAMPQRTLADGNAGSGEPPAETAEDKPTADKPRRPSYPGTIPRPMIS